ncbi:MAG: aspartyl/asparaginyl beta-hydroxylase domain-containing protein [Sphingorhabdus sp.]
MFIEGCRVKELGRIAGAEALADRVASLTHEQWRADRLRQELFSNVHADTETLVLLFCDGWPEVDVEKRAGWALLADVALPVMNHIVRNHYTKGGVVLRAMVAKLKPGGHIARHYDAHPSFAAAHRIHVPLVTNEAVKFWIDDVQFRFDAGFGYEINNLLNHEVKNDWDSDRVHFIFDYAPADQLQ